MSSTYEAKSEPYASPSDTQSLDGSPKDPRSAVPARRTNVWLVAASVVALSGCYDWYANPMVSLCGLYHWHVSPTVPILSVVIAFVLVAADLMKQDAERGRALTQSARAIAILWTVVNVALLLSGH